MDIKSAAAAYSNIAGIAQNTPPASNAKPTELEPSFAEMVNQSLSGAVDTGYKAEKISSLALLGKSDLTQLATAVGQAELALNTVVAIRDKVISAYQQIVQMPI